MRERHLVSNNTFKLALLFETHPPNRDYLNAGIASKKKKKNAQILTSIFTLLLSPSAIIMVPPPVKFLWLKFADRL